MSLDKIFIWVSRNLITSAQSLVESMLLAFIIDSYLESINNAKNVDFLLVVNFLYKREKSQLLR